MIRVVFQRVAQITDRSFARVLATRDLVEIAAFIESPAKIDGFRARLDLANQVDALVPRTLEFPRVSHVLADRGNLKKKTMTMCNNALYFSLHSILVDIE